MIIRFIWRNCNFRNKQWNALPEIDAFWVEATPDEALKEIFPLIKEEEQKESRRLAEQYSETWKEITDSDRSSCFLVAKDLSSIDPFSPFYPVHHMWNAYSPFEECPETNIHSLRDIPDIDASLIPKTTEVEPFSKQLKSFIEKEEWIFAKTYAKTWPHEYLVKKKVDPDLFTHLVRHIREKGYAGTFYKKDITYFDEDGFVYWTMGGVPIEEEDIVNRCPKEESYEYKRDHGLLPEQLDRFGDLEPEEYCSVITPKTQQD